MTKDFLNDFASKGVAATDGAGAVGVAAATEAMAITGSGVAAVAIGTSATATVTGGVGLFAAIETAANVARYVGYVTTPW